MIRSFVRLSLAVVFVVLSLPSHVAGAIPEVTPTVIAESDEWIAGPITDGRYVVWGTGGQIYARDLATHTTITVAAGELILGANTWCPDATIEDGILAWSRATGATNADGAPLFAVIVHDLATGVSREITTVADEQCPLRLSDGNLTYPRDGGVWLHSVRGNTADRMIWENENGWFMGLAGEWALAIQELDRMHTKRLVKSRIVARSITSGETRVLDEGWTDSDVPSVRGVIGYLVAYLRLFPTPEQAMERDGPWLTVTGVDGFGSSHYPWPAGCASPGIQVSGDDDYLLVSCHNWADAGGTDLWVTDLAGSSVFTVTLDLDFPVSATLMNEWLVWSQQRDDGDVILLMPWQEALPTARQTEPSSRPEATYFYETGHTLHFAFKANWERNGGLPVFGYPLTEEFLEKNADTGAFYTTQYFERQRFEFHPENQGTPYEVLLGRLGAEVAARDGLLATEPFRYLGDDQGPDAGCFYFRVTGHYACDAFRFYWQEHGLDLGDPGISYRESLALFGYPISEPFMTTNGDGHTVWTQYFERAVFELHPQNPAPYRVLLRRLGAEVLTGQQDTRQDYALVDYWTETLPTGNYGMGTPAGIAAGRDGLIYVTDTGCACLQVYRPDGTIVTQHGPFGEEDNWLTQPSGIDQDSNGLLYVADGVTGDVRVFSPEWGYETTFEGLVTEARDLAIDSHDHIYLVDGAGKVVKLDTAGKVLATWGGAASGALQFDDPHGITVDRYDDIYVADTGNQRVVKLSPQGEVLGVADLRDPLNERAPIDVAVDTRGFLYVIDPEAGTVWVLTQDGGVMRLLDLIPWLQLDENSKRLRLDLDEHDHIWITTGGGVALFNNYGVKLDTWFDAQRGTLRWLFGLSVAPNGDVLAVNRNDGWVYAFDASGKYLTGWGRGALDDVQLSGPTDVIVDREGRIFVTDPGNSRIVVYGPEYGVKQMEWPFVLDPGERVGPMTLALDDDGFLYVTTYGHVRVYAVDGALVRGWGASGSGPAVLGDIVGIAVHGDMVYVVDNTDHRIVVFDRAGTYIRDITAATGPQGDVIPFSDLREIRVDGAGNLYLADLAGHQILKLSPDGVVLARIDGTSTGHGPWDIGVSPEGIVYLPWYVGWEYGIAVLAPAH